MNTHARNLSYRLTMVSLYYRGHSTVAFVYLPIVNGRPVISQKGLELLDKQFAGLPRGTTFTVG